jgi:hypothetical protein
MASIVAVTLNQPTSRGGDVETQIERFAILYDTESGGRMTGTQVRDQTVPAVARAVPLRFDPQLNPGQLALTTTAEGAGTRISARLTQPAVSAEAPLDRETSVLIADASALAVTQALVEVLADSAYQAQEPAANAELTARLYAQLRVLIEDLGDLFPNLDLTLFAPLPDIPGLPDLDQYTFVNAYDHRLWQMTWSSMLGETTYSPDAIFELSVQSAAVTGLALSFYRQTLESMQSAAAAPQA